MDTAEGGLVMKATDLNAELARLADDLTAAGVQAHTDPTRVPVPGAWVTLDTLVADRFIGDWSATAAVYLVARDTGHTAAVAELTRMLEVLTTVSPSAKTARPDSVALPGVAGGPLPALQITTDIGD